MTTLTRNKSRSTEQPGGVFSGDPSRGGGARWVPGRRWRLVRGSHGRQRYWAGLTPRQWGFLAVGAFMLLCVTVPTLMWLLSPRASIPAFPSFYPPATPLASGPPESDTPAPDARVGEQTGTPAPGSVEPGTPAAAEPGTPARGEEIAASAPNSAAAPPLTAPTPGGQRGTPAPGGAAGPDPGDLVWPLEGDVIAEYGFAYSEVYGDWRLHPGIDIAGERGWAVRAAAPGTAKRVSREEGWVVEIDHGGGVVTAYGNLGEAGVRRGQKVTAGQVIGKLGDAAHLHFEVRVDGSAQDPLPWLKPR